MVTTMVSRAAPHYLIADGAPLAVRRTRGGDAWQARREAPGGAPAASGGAPAAGPAGVLLGMPAVGRPS
jgi:tRNA-2-methylthio-N6-dimethylallyladenosine synthase